MTWRHYAICVILSFIYGVLAGYVFQPPIWFSATVGFFIGVTAQRIVRRSFRKTRIYRAD